MLPSQVAAALRVVLPSGWSVEAARDTLTIRARAGRAARVGLALLEGAAEPREILRTLRARPASSPLLVGAGFLSPRAKDVIRERGASYADLTGNLRLALDRPAVYIQLEGARKNPAPPRRPLSSLKGPAAARGIRALAELPLPLGVNQLATAADVSPATASRVLALLDGDALAAREPGGAVRSIDLAGLLRRWAQDYSLLGSNTATGFLEPRGPKALEAKLREWTQPYAITGSLAASRKAPYSAPALATVYVDDPAAAAQDLRLVDPGVPDAANVFLIRPMDAVVFTRAWTEDGLRFAALPQVAVDLLTSPGRGPAEGEQLLAWLARVQ